MAVQKFRAAAVAFVLLASAALPARAADRAMADCQSTKISVSISGCTTVIKRGEKESLVNRVNAYYNRGNAYFNKGDLDRAIDDYGKSAELAPKFANAHFNRGNAYSSKHDLDNAIAEYSAVVEIDPHYMFAFFNRGNSYYAKGDLDNAISDYSTALQIDPTYVNAYVNRGNAYRDTKQFARAIDDYDAALKLDPKNKLAIANRRDAVSQQQILGPAVAKADEPAQTVATAGPDSKVPDLPPSAIGDNRVALVIGNSNYTAVAKLPNPPRDAAAVADALKSDGFASVTLVSDVTRADFIHALNAFADKASVADWAVVYYAGHGMELDGLNYLIPVDATLKADRDVQDQAISLDRVISAVSHARKLKLVILDACRNNPFAAKMHMTNGTRAIHRGLARIEPEGGTLVAYAAKGGEEALDGSGTGNSPFAAALVHRLHTPGLEVGKLFRLVRDDVLQATAKQQEPFVYGSLPGEDLFFRPQVN